MLTYSRPPIAGMGFIFKWNGREIPKDKFHSFMAQYIDQVNKKAKSDHQVISSLHYEIAKLEEKLKASEELLEAFDKYQMAMRKKNAKSNR